MKSQIIYSFEYSRLEEIKSQILQHCSSQVDKGHLENYFDNTIIPATQTQPMFMIAYQGNQPQGKTKQHLNIQSNFSGINTKKQLLILFSCHTEYQINLNLGKGLYLKKIYINPKVSEQIISQFFEINRDFFIKFNFVAINVENNLLNHYKDEDFSPKKIYYISQKQQCRQQYNPNLFDQINSQFQQIQFRYFQLDDYGRGLFNLLSSSYQFQKPQFQQFQQQYQELINQASVKHIHIVGVDRQTDNIQLFGTILISDTVFGKRALGGNIVASRQAKTNGNDELLVDLLINQGLKDPQTKVNFYTIQSNPYNSTRFSLQQQCTILLREGSHFNRQFQWQFLRKSKL